MGQGPESWADWKNLPVEFMNGRFRHVCSVWSGVFMLKNHSMSSTLAFITGLLPPDGKVVDNSVQQ
jgi:hypothetical protein